MNILVYDDNPDFGGHQVMACLGIEALVETPGLNITLMYNPENRRLIQMLDKCSGLETIESDPALIQSLNPDLVLCIQGDIAQSTAGIMAAKKAKIECVSYIAIPHRLSEMGAKLGSLRDSKNRALFKKPDRFITISESMASRLKKRGAKQRIDIVQNGIPAPPIPKLTQHDDKFTLGLVGRIEFKQKQQDFLVHAFKNHPAHFSNTRILFVGSGPDEQKLKKLIKGNDNIALLPWQDNMEEIYELLDMLVIPSRYEGVPLVMLEALARGIPVIGNRRDGMADYLPETWTFNTGNSAEIATTFDTVRESWKQKIESLQNRVLEECSLNRFKADFVKVVTGK